MPLTEVETYFICILKRTFGGDDDVHTVQEENRIKKKKKRDLAQRLVANKLDLTLRSVRLQILPCGLLLVLSFHKQFFEAYCVP